ncbi:MAG: hypothetical protein JWQ90_1205 [Hydrocarboniphaga sp.]|uniref:TonB-dependent receptor n=1 Tax=Hydrocarboniphaga sp. TaxID=2033016 RepID=UPI00262A9A08|nr:TonB-dependent receptor [Hydrocarboniphaga sp.]MDB5968755.1 hypothetical protein [Hydrocarboniphaga sp.]
MKQQFLKIAISAICIAFSRIAAAQDQAAGAAQPSSPQDASAPETSEITAPSSTARTPAPDAAPTADAEYYDVVPVSVAQEPKVEPALPAAHSGPQVEEVVVTATRKEETLQNVNIAVTAITAEQMKTDVVLDLRGLSRMTPSLNVTTGLGNSLAPIVSLRGQVQSDPTTLTLDPSVGMYLDDVYLGRSPGSLLDMFDIERVEVLKGPQGTLYGRNSTGGAIRVIPVKAVPGGGWDGFLRASGGSYGAAEVEGASNIPVTPDLAFRFSGSLRTLDGWGKQLLAVPQTLSDTPTQINGSRPSNDRDQIYSRLNGVWRATESLDVELGLDYTQQKSNGSSLYEASGDLAQQTIPGGPISFVRSSNDFYTSAVDAAHENKVEATTDGYYLKANYELPFGILKLVQSGRALDATYHLAVDGTSTGAGLNDTDQKVHQDSTELQLLGTLFDDRLEYVAGVYAFSERGKDHTDLTITLLGLNGGLGPYLPADLAALLGKLPDVISILPTTYIINSRQDMVVHNKSESIFARLTYHFTDWLALTAGVRPIIDSKQAHRSTLDSGLLNQLPSDLVIGPFVGGNGNTLGGTPDCVFNPSTPGVVNDGTQCYIDVTKKYHYTTYTAGLDWRPGELWDLGPAVDSLLIYLKTSTGARSGGQQPRTTTTRTAAPFKPEFVEDIELGAKGDYFGHRLRLNLAAYHTDYSDFQTSVIADDQQQVINASDAKINGAELEASFAVTDELLLNASGSFLDFKFDDSTYIPPYSSKFQYNLSPTWHQQTGFGEWGAAVGYSWRSRSNLYPQREPVYDNPALLQQKPFGLITASSYVKFDRWNTRIGLFGTNLANQKYKGNAYPTVVNIDVKEGGIISPGSPRLIGLEVIKTFGTK